MLELHESSSTVFDLFSVRFAHDFPDSGLSVCIRALSHALSAF